MKSGKKPLSLEARRKQTRNARDVRLGTYPLKNWIENEFVSGMQAGKWRNRAEAATELFLEANKISALFRTSINLCYAVDYCKDSERAYPQKLYRSLAPVEARLKALGIEYRNQTVVHRPK